MKLAITICFLLLSLYSSSLAQQEKLSDNKLQYDSLLAKKLGADQYGMKKYVMAFLKSGPVKIQDSTQRAELQREHLKNIFRLAKEGTLIVAGPFLDDQSIRGIFIFNVESVEEAKKIAETDPSVKAGVLTLELHLWYGSAALLEIPRIHKMIQKNSIIDQ